jgi:hypothetical protein
MNEINSRMNDTKLESIPASFPLINPNEKAQISETISR